MGPDDGRGGLELLCGCFFGHSEQLLESQHKPTVSSFNCLDDVAVVTSKENPEELPDRDSK